MSRKWYIYLRRRKLSKIFPNLKTFRKHHKSHVSCTESSLSTENYIEVVCPSDKNISSQNCQLTEFTFPTSSEDKDNPINSQELLNRFKQSLRENNILFINSLYKDNSFCRKDIDKIMTGVQNLFCNPINKLKEYIVNDVSTTYIFLARIN